MLRQPQRGEGKHRLSSPLRFSARKKAFTYSVRKGTEMIYIDNTTATQYIPIPYPRELEGSGTLYLILTDEASGEAVTITGDGETDGDYIVAEVTMAAPLRMGEYHYTLHLEGAPDDYDTKGVAYVGEYREPYITDTTEGINIIQYER